MNEVKEKCFADAGNKCMCLKEKQCDNCLFYRSKTENEILKDKYPFEDRIKNRYKKGCK